MAWFVFIIWSSLCLLISSVLSAVVAVRYSVFERFVTIVLRKGLRRVSDLHEDGSTYTVERTTEGVTVEKLILAHHVLNTLGIELFQVASLSAGYCRVEFPGLTKPLRVSLAKVCVVLEQRQLPQHVAPEALDAQRVEVSSQLKAAKLAAVEKLLWGNVTAHDSSKEPQKGGGEGSHLKARMLHRMLAFAVQYVQVSVSDIQVTYSQRNDPGPAPAPGSHLQGRDCLQLSIRQIALQPAGPKPVEDDSDAEEDVSALPAGSEPPMPVWLQLLCLPRATWRHLTLNEPRTCSASLAGVSLTITAYGARQRDPSRQQAPPANKPSVPQPESLPQTEAAQASAQLPAEQSPFSAHPATFTFGTNTGPSSRRRKRARVPAATAGSSVPQGSESQSQAGDDWPTERHIILQSWGASVRLHVLPPSWSSAAAADNSSQANNAAAKLAHDINSRPDNVVRMSQRSEDQPNETQADRPGPAFDDNSPSHRSQTAQRSSRGSVDGSPHASALSRSGPITTSQQGVTLSLEVTLRALMPVCDTAALIVGMRMTERLQKYEQYVQYWSSRPQVPVAGRAALWWQHAGRATVSQCQRLTRSQVPMQNLGRRRAHRLKFQELYRASHASLSSFREPERRWWQRRRVARADKAMLRALRAAEERLTLEEVAHFSAGVAQRYSASLQSSEAFTAHVMDAVDAIVGNLGPLQPALEAMLLQQGQHHRADMLALRISITCPKLGVMVKVGDAWTASLPQPVAKAFTFLEASLHNSEFLLHPSGEVDASVDCISVGGTKHPGRAVSDPVLRSPSNECMHLLRVTDLHAMASRETSFLRGASNHQRFLDMHIGPISTACAQKASSAQQFDAHMWPHVGLTADERRMDMQPSSLQINFVLAGVEVIHTQSVVMAALTFASHLKRHQAVPLQQAAGQAPTCAEQRLPGSPQTLADQVLQSFALNNIPIHQPLILPMLIPSLECPGIVVRIPYRHADTFMHKAHTTGESAPVWDYQLVAAITRIRLQRYDDDFADFMRFGALRRSYAQVYLDLFSYQPPSSRASDQEDTHGMRMLKLSTRRRTESEPLLPDVSSSAADDQDIAAMAKVWAHPEDLHLYQGAFWDGGPRGEGLERQSTVHFDRTVREHASASTARKQDRPFPMVPLLKISGFDAEILQKVHALPAAPGSLHAAAAVGAIGIMAWVSPWQVAHVLSIIKAVHEAIPPVDPIWEQAVQQTPPPTRTAAAAMNTQMRLGMGIEIPLISLMCSVAKTHSSHQHRESRRPHRQVWGRQIAESDLAYQWSQHLSPVYGINLVGFRSAMRYLGAGAMKGGAVIDGILARDLQMKPDSPFAHFLKPLPAKAKRLASYVAKFRRRLLRLSTYSPCHKLWMKAVRKIVFTRRALMGMRAHIKMDSVGHISRPFASLFGSMVHGTQLAVLIEVPAPHKFPGHPAYRPAQPMRLHATAGQMLLHLRVSSNNRMLPFTMQLIELISDRSADAALIAPAGSASPAAAADPAATAAAACAVQPAGSSPAGSFQGLQLNVAMEGVDVTMVVEGQELVSLKLQIVELETVMAASGQHLASQDALVVNFTVEDMIVRDLKAMDAHSIVLRPNTDANACSLSLAFHKPVSAEQPALLVVEVANPRILALLRFVHDILHGVDIVMLAAKPNKPAAKTAAAPAPASAAADVRAPGLEFVIHVLNAGIVLPSSSRSHQVLACDIEYLAVGMPGEAVPAEELSRCMLPSVAGMVQDSLHSCRLFAHTAAATQPPAAAAQHDASTAPAGPVPAQKKHSGLVSTLARTMTPGAKVRMAPSQAAGRQAQPRQGAEGRGSRARLAHKQSQGIIFPDLESRPSRQPVKPPGILDIATGPRSNSRSRAESASKQLATPFAQAQPTSGHDPGPPGAQLSSIPEHQASAMPAHSSRLMPSPGRMRAESGAGEAQGSQQLSSAHAPKAAEIDRSVDVLAGSHTAFPALDAGQEHSIASEGMPASQVAVLADGVAISRAVLAHVHDPLDCRHAQCPDSFAGHAWPVLEHDLQGRSSFLHHSSFAIVVFEQTAETGAKFTQLHMAASPILALLNKPNYSSLLGFVQGNLTEASSFQSVKEAADAPKLQRFTFNPEFKFGPPAGDMPTFRMTADMPEVASMFEADPAFWQSGAIRSRLGDINDLARLPFLRLKIQGIGLDLGLLAESKATYISVTAAEVTLDDLRLAYSKIMTEYEVTDDEDEDASAAASALEASASAGRESYSAQDVAPELQSSFASAAQATPRQQRQPVARGSAGGASLFDRDQLLDWNAPNSPAMNRATVLQQAGRLRPVHRPSQDMRGVRQKLTAQHRGFEATPLPSPFDKALVPIVSMEKIEQLQRFFPSGAPTVRLMQTPFRPPDNEAAHLHSRKSSHSSNLEATIAVMQDGTVAVEADVSHALVQWPFLTDISFVWAAASIFQPEAATGGDPAEKAAVEAAAQKLDKSVQQPWIYLNIVLRHSQLFLPVLDLVTMRDPVHHYFGGGAAALNMHERMADLLLMVLSLSMESPGAALRLEERGAAFSFEAVRVAYSMGGDGQSDVRTDVRNLAAFVRDPAACVTCVLLPVSFHAHIEMEVPQAAELSALEEVLQAAIRIQRVWRKWRKNTTAEQRIARRLSSRRESGGTSQGPGSANGDAAAEMLRRGSLAGKSSQASPMAADSPTAADLCTIDSLIQEVATPRTRATLQEYEDETKQAQSHASTAALARSTQHSLSHTRVSIKLVSCTVRAAFSHIPFLQSLMWMVNNIALVPTMGNVAADIKAPTGIAAVEQERTPGFRPSKMQMDAALQSIAVVLCNDKPQTFGAPDVLQLTTHQVLVHFAQDTEFADRPPNQVVRAAMHVSAAFLNNSSSRWEAIWDAWDFKAELVDHVSPIYRSDFLRNVRLQSGQHLNVNFNPSALLSFGDALAFANTLLDVDFNDPGFMRQPGTLGRLATVSSPENAPQLAEQMAQKGGITARVPQKYLIQNQSGLRLYYWGEESAHGGQSTHMLASGVSETLKVEPVRKVLRTVVVGKGGALEKAGNVINLLFEGNWMPVKDVAVSVVGKYRYQMLSPSEHNRVPVLVDIILVGRTKIITVHSSMWVDNRMDKRLTFRLHVPVTPLTAPAAGGSGSSSRSDTVIGPVLPEKGVYLPLTAVLGGRLFVIPEGYKEAQRDVIRLSSDIAELTQQQGHIECEPLPTFQGGPVLPVALHCTLVVTPAQVNSEFQAFKHIEVLSPGELQRASEPLEATLAIHPTLILTNALPYYMEVIVWQVSAFGRLREQQSMADKFKLKYTWRMMQTAYQGLLPIVAADPVHAQQETHRRLERASMSNDNRGPPRFLRAFSLEPGRPVSSTLVGQHIVVGLQPGVSQCVYADMRGNVLVHCKVPSLGLNAVQWAVVSWAASQKQRETVYDAKYFYRLPSQVRMRNTHKRENMSQHTDDVVGEVKHAARRLRRALLLQKGRAARPRTEFASPNRMSSSWPRQAAPAMPAAAAAAERNSDNAGKPETTTEGAVSTVADINDLAAVPSPDALAAMPNTDVSGSSVVQPGSSAMAPMVSKTAMAGPAYSEPSASDAESESPMRAMTPAVSRFAQEHARQRRELDWDVEDEEVQAALKHLQREIFVAWREAAAARHARRAAGIPAGPSQTQLGQGADASAREGGGGAPDTLYMGLDNSLAGGHGAQPLCRLTFFASYWVDNRTGLDLVFHDHQSAPQSPILLGARVPFDTTSVRVNGSGLLEAFTPKGTRKDVWGANEASEISVQPVLLNKQDATKFCLADAGRKRFSQSINIKTVGLKGTHHIKGQDPTIPKLTAFMRQNLQAVLGGGADSALSPDPSGALDRNRPSSLSAAQDSTVSIKPDETQDSVPGNASEPGRPLRTISSAVQIDITPLVDVAIQGAPETGDGDAQLKVSERDPSGLEAGNEHVVSVNMNIVPTKEVHLPAAATQGRQQQPSQAGLANVVIGPSDEQVDGEEPAADGLGALADETAVLKRAGQREFIFTVEVGAGPPNSVFRHTKVVTVKSKYVVENQTGMALDVKQRGTPDLQDNPHYGVEERCACRLPHDSRWPAHFDDAELNKELVIRPVDEQGRSIWHWSGSFHLRDRDEYLGLRVRLKSNPARAINIPVNATVGPSGTVLITFKSPRSIPPYRIENQCDDVYVYFAQSGVAWDRAKWNWLQPRMGGARMAYAWDEPILDHKLTIQAHAKAKAAHVRPVKAHYSLEHLGAQQPLSIPSASSQYSSVSNLQEMQERAQQDPEISKETKDRVSSMLASEFSRKVYVTVFADGPTRVLQFSDEPNVANADADLSIIDLAARLKQVEAELHSVSMSFAKLHGRGELALDLYGRGPAQAGAHADNQADAERPELLGMQRRSRLRLRQRQGTTTGPAMPDRAVGAPVPLPRSPAHSFLPPVEPGGGAHAVKIEGIPEPRPINVGNVGVSGAGEIVPVSPAGSSGSDDEAVDMQQAQQAIAAQTASNGATADRGHIGPVSARELQGSKLMRQAVDGDSSLLLGGDLMVSIREAEGLQGTERNTHTFVRVRVAQNMQLTSVQWSTLSPRWDEVLTFKDMSAASELVLELWDVGGSKNAKHLENLAHDPTKVISSSRFMGRVEVPLSETLNLRRGARRWHTLMRGQASDEVSGRIRLGFAWDVSARSLMHLKLNVLERVYAQRMEILCMLRPVSPQIAFKWMNTFASATAPKQHQPAQAADGGMGDSGDGSEVMIGAFLEELHSTLHVDVIEARGLHPRKGVVVAFQANQLPCPEVEVTIPGRPPYSVCAQHTLKPRYEGRERGSYHALSSKAAIMVRLYDRKSRRRRTLLGQAAFCADSIKGNDPVYVWVPLRSPPALRFPKALLVNADAKQYMGASSLGPANLQVFMRLQWERQVVRGQSMRLEVKLEGLGVSVMGGLQDELFNLTMDKIEWSSERTRLELQMRGSVKRLQLDNQMLDATQPVVMAPASAAHAHSETAASLRGADAPLVTFAVTRSFANNLTLTGPADSTTSLPAGNHATPIAQAAQAPDSVTEGGAAIWSFKLLSLTIGELDISADDGFLEAIMSFIVSIPTADIWQDAAWREQQKRLLTAQFGPREVESLAMNAVLPLAAQQLRPNAPLFWVQERELHELQVLRDQSSYSSWYFIEQAKIGDINANVTIALTSSVLSGRGGVGTTAEPTGSTGGMFSRVIGASGFQLINVNNVPLSLRGYRLESKLLGRNALINSMIRHYTAAAISEAHKVLGGAGPAIAAVPLTAIWAGTSVVTLLASVGSGKVGPVGAGQRVGFVIFMSLAGVVSSFSRMGLAVMTAIPPERSGYLSDRGALTRAVQRPTNAFEAFSRANEEIVAGVLAALYGIILDPTRGYHQGRFAGRIPDACIGTAKAVLGIVIRPTAGMLEWVSKGTHGLGLVCLGREAISGSAQRRMRAPGSLVDDSPDALDDVRAPEIVAQRRQLMGAWQRSLPNLFPQMQGDKLTEVVPTHDKRVMLLTDRHLGLLSVKSTGSKSTYKALWVVGLREVQTVRGDDDKLRLYVGYSQKLDAAFLGVWTIPHKKSIKCNTRDMLERVTMKVNRALRAAESGQKQALSEDFDLLEGQELTFLDRPYRP